LQTDLIKLSEDTEATKMKEKTDSEITARETGILIVLALAIVFIIFWLKAVKNMRDEEQTRIRGNNSSIATNYSRISKIS